MSGVGDSLTVHLGRRVQSNVFIHRAARALLACKRSCHATCEYRNALDCVAVPERPTPSLQPHVCCFLVLVCN